MFEAQLRGTRVGDGDGEGQNRGHQPLSGGEHLSASSC